MLVSKLFSLILTSVKKFESFCFAVYWISENFDKSFSLFCLFRCFIIFESWKVSRNLKIINFLKLVVNFVRVIKFSSDESFGKAFFQTNKSSESVLMLIRLNSSAEAFNSFNAAAFLKLYHTEISKVAQELFLKNDKTFSVEVLLWLGMLREILKKLSKKWRNEFTFFNDFI